MEELKLYRDLHGNEFIQVAENATEVFLAPVTGSQYKDDSMEIHMDYGSIKVFEKEQPGYYIKIKNQKVITTDGNIKAFDTSYNY